MRADGIRINVRERIYHYYKDFNMVTSNPTSTLYFARRKKIESLFLRLHYKLRLPLRNKSNSMLSIDILRDSAKRDLLKFVMLNIETTLLNFIKKDFAGFDEEAVLLNLVKISAEDFLVAWYGPNLTIDPKIIVRSIYFQLLLENSTVLLRLPFLTLLDLDSKIFRSIFHPIYDAASDKFLEVLFDNLLVEISNCVVSLMVNEFATIDSTRQLFYRSYFLSSRNLDRFKNSLMWRTQLRRYVSVPKNLYNSQYRIWRIRSKGIYHRIIYANRSNTLTNLEPSSLITVTLIEVFDFLSTRFNDTLYLVGEGIRNSFISVIGRSVAIVWRGIIDELKK